MKVLYDFNHINVYYLGVKRIKLDRDILFLEKSIAKSDFTSARIIIEHNKEKLSSPRIRSKLSMEALTFLNCVIQLNSESNQDLLSRETLLIIRHINSLAYDCKFAELKSYSFLQKDLLSNPKIYNSLCEDAKTFLPKPKNIDMQEVAAVNNM
ncbi:hypothetical protein [Rummeliibacillus pycnus]|uniref:hypothetical protein n=1 Tax=Rummeliibacillus pycnus TaxID=101070 RepID=UPI0037C92AB9